MSATDAAPGSPLDKLRKSAERRRRGAELHLPVPGWADPTLVARVVVVGESAIARIAGEPGSVDWLADFVAATVEGLYAYENGKLEPLPGPTGAPLLFEPAFGEAIGAEEVETARAAVFAAFMDGGEDTPPTLNVLALGEFADKIERWQANTSRTIAGSITPGS